ncbi:hypothetical protein C7S20_09400 [Christiangramia fulva]|uniref:DUF2383 domain-containing protein n=1 Tax=Christiangramia fulva TaxID=2126553 RepID=A0A2R3Z5B0_9FLAO|nr:hypothetical protein [Christiangramia fulva]AVR45467.1 hypothetical protein C7S20_09400 [Christiangramia fulva]
MRLSEKKKTLELLEKLRVLNYKSAFIYEITYQKEKRLMLRKLYQQLHQQKKEFLLEIEEKIEQLKKEISPIPDPEKLAFYKRKKLIISQLYLKYKMKCNLTYAHKRELKSYKKYCKYLSQTNHGGVRAIILDHKHRIRSLLNEMNSTGIINYQS